MGSAPSEAGLHGLGIPPKVFLSTHNGQYCIDRSSLHLSLSKNVNDSIDRLLKRRKVCHNNEYTAAPGDAKQNLVPNPPSCFGSQPRLRPPYISSASTSLHKSLHPSRPSRRLNRRVGAYHCHVQNLRAGQPGVLVGVYSPKPPSPTAHLDQDCR